MDPFTSSPSASGPLSEPPWFREGIAALIAAEPRFAQVALPVPFVAREGGFRGLLRTICGQQVSHAAAGAIWRRFSSIPGALDPATLPEMNDDTLCGLGGLTRSRAAHARALARAVVEGTLDLAALPHLGDEAAVAMLTAVKGIGPWTAETHLVLSELRHNVFPAGDVALAAGVAHLLDLPARPSPAALRELTKGWAPWRGVAARMLWHHWLLVTGRPAWDRD